MRKKSRYAPKLKRATQLLFFKHHRKPGVKGWELRKKLGADYLKVLALLNSHLEKLDLQVKTVYEDQNIPEKPTKSQMDRARFYVTLRGGSKTEEAKMMGWRIDDIAGLAITISTILAKRGKASTQEVEQLLAKKLPKWQVRANMDRYVRSGYIERDEKGLLYLDWRTRAEIDEKTLVDSLMAK